MATCSVCCEKFNKTINASVVCKSCDFNACKKCVRTYLLGCVSQPHCMNCKVMWNHQFLVENLNRTFVDNDLKKSRKQIILDEHKSKLVDYMYLVENETEKRRLIEKEKIEKKKLEELRQELRKQEDKVQHIKIQVTKIKNNRLERDENGLIKSICGESVERKKFIMPCRSDGCRGFLSSQYKCELCEKFTCSKCYEIIGSSEDKETHVCKEENILSTEAIKKDSKPCPGCGIRIHKVVGCSQMFCTECRTVFDYNTLKIQYGGHIHNPHYHEMKKAEGNVLPNMVNEVLCDGLIDLGSLNVMFQTLDLRKPLKEYSEPKVKQFYVIFCEKNNVKIPSKEEMYTNTNANNYGYNYRVNRNTYVGNKQDYSFRNIVSNFYRYISELKDVHINRLNNKIGNIDRESKEEVTLDYLLKNIDEKTLASKLQTLDATKHKCIEKLHIYELIFAYAKDILNSLYNDTVVNMNELQLPIHESRAKLEYSIIDNLYKMDKIINYCNRQLAIQSFTHNTVVEGFENIYKMICITHGYVQHGKLNELYLHNNTSVTKAELDKIMQNDDVIVSDIIKARPSLYIKKQEQKQEQRIKQLEKQKTKAGEASSSNGVTKTDLMS